MSSIRQALTEPRALPPPPMFQVRAGVLALGLTLAEISGSSAEKALIPPGRTAMGCSATFGDTCLTPRSNASHQKAAAFDLLKACGFGASVPTLAVPPI